MDDCWGADCLSGANSCHSPLKCNKSEAIIISLLQKGNTKCRIFANGRAACGRTNESPRAETLTLCTESQDQAFTCAIVRGSISWLKHALVRNPMFLPSRPYAALPLLVTSLQGTYSSRPRVRRIGSPDITNLSYPNWGIDLKPQGTLKVAFFGFIMRPRKKKKKNGGSCVGEADSRFRLLKCLWAEQVRRKG